MICERGMFVIESKNYSGWIFGKSEDKQWCQTLRTGRRKSHKEFFYNPILQNKTHIKALESLLDKKISMWSIVAFSNDCSFRNLQINTKDAIVINYRNLFNAVKNIYLQPKAENLTEEEIERIYEFLYPYTQVDEITKFQHTLNAQYAKMASEGKKLVRVEIPIDKTDNNEADEKELQFERNHESNASDHSEPEHNESNHNIVDQSIANCNEDDNTNNTEEASVIVEPKPIATKTENLPPDIQNESKCPICNGKLVLRTATKGKNAGNNFYGCCNYPKCKYIKNIEKASSQYTEASTINNHS